MIQTLLPPKLPAVEHGEDLPIVAVRMNISDEPQFKFITPPENVIGVFLLAAFLKSELKLAGLPPKSTSHSLPLNKSLLIFVMESQAHVLPALETICNALTAVNLLNLATVGWCDVGEGVLRGYSPRGCIIPFPTDAETDEALSQVNKGNEIVQAMRPQNNQGESPAAK